MSRKIPTATKDIAFRLWLQGHAYREIHNRTGMSLGAINQMVAEARAKISSIEGLRELNIVLRKGGASVHDAVRGAKLLDVLNERGVGLDTLHSYIELSERMSSERGVEAERFVDAAMRLTNLEAKTGKSYEDVVKDFEERAKQVEDLDAKAKDVQGQIQGLMERKAQLEGEIHETEKRFSLTRQELDRAISIQKRLQKLGIDRVASLAVFIGYYEALGFNAQEVQRLAEWRKSLKEMGIDPDVLGRFVKEKGPLEKQISEIEKECRRVGGIVKKLRDEHVRLFEETTSLQGLSLKLSNLDKVLKLGKIIIACRVCGRQGIFVKLHTGSEYRGVMRGGVALQYRCLCCGRWSMYTPWEILTEVGLLATPELKEVQTPTSKD